MKSFSYSISNFYCTGCNLRFPIPRKRANQRKRGHIKSLWCPRCSTLRRFVEVREKDFEPEIFKEGSNGNPIG